MMLPRRFWHEMTTRDFADSDTAKWIAVLPVAAIEQHGPFEINGDREIMRALELRLGRQLSPITIYRALAFLQGQGLVSRIETRNAFVPCAYPSHSHACAFFICEHCGSSAEIENAKLEALFARAEIVVNEDDLNFWSDPGLRDGRSPAATPYLDSADMVIGMERVHLSKLRQLVPQAEHLYLLSDFDPNTPPGAEIEDPWYGDDSDFIVTLHQIEGAMPELMKRARELLG